ncbi:hypothetical protein BKA80DRAFT_84150 [Phyllosticta citrichinensis]
MAQQQITPRGCTAWMKEMLACLHLANTHEAHPFSCAVESSIISSIHLSAAESQDPSTKPSTPPIRQGTQQGRAADQSRDPQPLSLSSATCAGWLAGWRCLQILPTHPPAEPKNHQDEIIIPNLTPTIYFDAYTRPRRRLASPHSMDTANQLFAQLATLPCRALSCLPPARPPTPTPTPTVRAVRAESECGKQPGKRTDAVGWSGMDVLLALRCAVWMDGWMDGWLVR